MTTTNIKTKYNQNCQKIELYRSLATKELKKKHSVRPVGGVDMGSWGGEDSWSGGDWRARRGSSGQSRRSNICVQINQEG